MRMSFPARFTELVKLLSFHTISVLDRRQLFFSLPATEVYFSNRSLLSHKMPRVLYCVWRNGLGLLRF